MNPPSNVLQFLNRKCLFVCVKHSLATQLVVSLYKNTLNSSSLKLIFEHFCINFIVLMDRLIHNYFNEARK